MSRTALTEFKEKLDKTSRYKGIYDMEEDIPPDYETIRTYLHYLIDPCKVVAVMLGTGPDKSRFFEQKLRLGLGKKKAVFRLEGDHLPGSLRDLPGQWRTTGVSIQRGDMATVKRILDFLTLWPLQNFF